MDFKKSNFVYFDKAAKLCKAFEYAFNEWVAKGVASDSHDFILQGVLTNKYGKVASSNTSCLEAHAGFFRLLIKGIFDPYVL